MLTLCSFQYILIVSHLSWTQTGETKQSVFILFVIQCLFFFQMPLGKLSKAQLAKGTKVLEEIEEELGKEKPNISFLTDASNRFYTIIPQDFGSERPPIIDNKTLLQEKYDLLAVCFSFKISNIISISGFVG